MTEANWTDMNAMNRVREGMHVVDAAGEDVGRVEQIHMGDELATTTDGNEARNPTPFDLVAEALGGEHEPDVPEPLRSRLVRSGYLKLDGPHLLEADRYVPTEYITAVEGDRVRLRVRKDEVVRED